MKAATYLRVSTTEQDVEAQRLELAGYLRRRGIETAVEFADVMSGAKKERPGLDAMLAAVKRGEVDTVICVKLDRMGRSLSHLARLLDFFREHKTALVCTSQNIDTTTGSAMGNMQLGILGVFAAFERDVIRERTIAGLAVARAAGKVLGRPSERMRGLDKEDIMARWGSEGKPGGYRELGRRLGGVSGATAWRAYDRNAASNRQPVAAPALNLD